MAQEVTRMNDNIDSNARDLFEKVTVRGLVRLCNGVADNA